MAAGAGITSWLFSVAFGSARLRSAWDQMTSASTAIVALAVLILAGCASQSPRSDGTLASGSKPALPLTPGEMIRLVPTSIADPPDGMVVLIDSAGDVSPLLGVRVHIAGLTPAEAAAAIQKAYQPRYFTHWDFTVTRVRHLSSPRRQ